MQMATKLFLKNVYGYNYTLSTVKILSMFIQWAEHKKKTPQKTVPTFGKRSVESSMKILTTPPPLAIIKILKQSDESKPHYFETVYRTHRTAKIVNIYMQVHSLGRWQMCMQSPRESFAYAIYYLLLKVLHVHVYD